MSKIVTTESLSLLRDEFKNYEALDDFLDHFQNDEFDFQNVELKVAREYPEITEEDIDKFYKAFSDDPKNEFRLARIIYEALPLNSLQASNNLFWLYLNLGSFFKYIKKRWIQILTDEEEDNAELKAREIDKYILSLESSQNSLIKSPIAGLWWSIHLTVDESIEDKYYYSKIFLSERNLRDKNFGTYKLIRDKNVFQAMLDFYHKYKDFELDGKRIGSEAIAQQTAKMLNQIGGLTILSYLEKQEIIDIMEEYKSTIFYRARELQLGKIESRKRLEKLRANEDDPSLFSDDDNYDGPDNSETSKQTKSTDRPNSNDKILKYFNLKINGDYNLTKKRESNWPYQIGIPKSHKNGYLFICYNENGYINRVKISELLKKKRDLYQNGIFENNTVSQIFSIADQAIIGIVYQNNGIKYFKAHLSDQFKKDNGNVGLQGYKTLYDDYDTVEFFILPIELKKELDKLIFKSFTASGKALNNSYYRKEFKIIKQRCNVNELKLF